MRPTAILAIVLIVAGIVALAYQGITYTTREKVVDIGSVHVMADRTKSVPLPPCSGGHRDRGRRSATGSGKQKSLNPSNPQDV